MGYVKLGRVRPVFCGEWSEERAYTVLEMVRGADGRRAYIALKDVPAGTALSNAEYWEVMLDLEKAVDLDLLANYESNVDALKASNEKLAEEMENQWEASPYAHVDLGGYVRRTLSSESAAETESTTRIASEAAISISGRIKILPGGQKVWWYRFDDQGLFSGESSGQWLTEETEASFDGDYKFVIANLDDSDILPTDAKLRVLQCTDLSDRIEAHAANLGALEKSTDALTAQVSALESASARLEGELDDRFGAVPYVYIAMGEYVNKTLSSLSAAETESTTRISNRTAVAISGRVKILPNGQKVWWYHFDDQGAFSGASSGKWLTEETEAEFDGRYKFVIANVDDSEIAPSDAQARIVKCSDLSDTIEQLRQSQVERQLSFVQGTIYDGGATDEVDHRVCLNAPISLIGSALKIATNGQKIYVHLYQNGVWVSYDSQWRTDEVWTLEDASYDYQIVVANADDSALTPDDVAVKVYDVMQTSSAVERQSEQVAEHARQIDKVQTNAAIAPMVVRSIAHRGYSASVPENTIAAYRMAKEKGFGIAETDIRMTADGKVACIHDDTVDRTTDGAGMVASMTLKQLQMLDAGSWKSSAYAGEKIPSFEEFLSACRALGLHPYIEIKGTFSQAQLIAAYRTAVKHGFRGHMTWFSFDYDAVATISAHDPACRVGWSVSEVTEEIAASAAKLLSGKNEVFLACDASGISDEAAERCMDAGVQLEAWTVDTDAGILALPSYVTGVYSNKLRAGAVICEGGL